MPGARGRTGLRAPSARVRARSPLLATDGSVRKRRWLSSPGRAGTVRQPGRLPRSTSCDGAYASPDAIASSRQGRPGLDLDRRAVRAEGGSRRRRRCHHPARVGCQGAQSGGDASPRNGLWSTRRENRCGWTRPRRRAMSLVAGAVAWGTCCGRAPPGVGWVSRRGGGGGGRAGSSVGGGSGRPWCRA